MINEVVLRRVSVLFLVSCLPPTATAQTVLHTTWGPESASVFGITIAPASDMNQDGVPDFLVTDSSAATIAVSIRSGVDGAPLGGLPNGPNVAWVARDGGQDVDSDGIPDILVGGANGKPGVFSGASLLAIREHSGKEAGDLFGNQGRFLGDLDLDGVPDYAFQAPYTQSAPNKLDYVRVYSGSTGQLIGEYTSPAAGWQFGCDVEPLGDITGDGASEYMISAPFADIGANPNSNEGLIRVIDGVTGGVLTDLWGGVGDHIGCYIGQVGDWDGDTLNDIAVLRGPPQEVRVMSVATGATIFESAPPDPGTFYRVLRASDDIDGDGKRDVLVSQWLSNPLATPGVVAMGEGLQKIFQFDRPASEVTGAIFYPTDLAALGDVDGDGRGDWAISHLIFNPSGVGAGNVRVVSGKPLHHDQPAIEAATNYRVDFELNAGLPRAGNQYILLAGATGAAPGVPVNNQLLPLNFDFLTDVSIAFANTSPFNTTLGTFDAYGQATAWFDGSILPPVAVGANLVFGYYSVGPGGVYVSTNPVVIPVLQTP